MKKDKLQWVDGNNYQPAFKGQLANQVHLENAIKIVFVTLI